MSTVRASAPLVAIFNSASDVVERLCHTFERGGFRTIAGRLADIQSGDLDFVAFLEAHDPDVLVVDLPRPYQRNLNIVRLLRAADQNSRRLWIVTTVQKAPLELLMTPLKWTGPIIGQPFGPDDVLAAVREMLRSRPPL
jgi:DNA-binding response OmpR family regulator